MPLFGIFFVSLYHQSNRKNMFKKTDPNPQLDMFTAPSMQLGSRASKKYSDSDAWHNQFYGLVTAKIDEDGLTIRELAQTSYAYSRCMWMTSEGW